MKVESKNKSPRGFLLPALMLDADGDLVLVLKDGPSKVLCVMLERRSTTSLKVGEHYVHDDLDKFCGYNGVVELSND